jgi:hypothetical protein
MIENYMIMNYMTILFVHLLYDFHLQGQFIGEYKSKNMFIMFIHCLAYTLSINITMYWMGMFHYWHIPVLLISHFLIDSWKCKVITESEFFNKILREKIGWGTLYLDQFFHMVVLFVICYFQ